MSEPSPPDPRTRTSVGLAKPFRGAKAVYPVGTQAVQISIVRVNGRTMLAFEQPSASALAFRSCMESGLRLVQARTAVKTREITSVFGEAIDIRPTADVFDMFSAYMSLAILAHASIEYFANEVITRYPTALVSIPRRKPPHGRGRKRKVKTVALEAGRVERLSLDEKLGTVLPQILSCPTPKGTACWQPFLALKKLRNDVVHMKGFDLNPRLLGPNTPSGESNVYRPFLEKSPSTYFKAPILVFNHFRSHISTISLDWVSGIEDRVREFEAVHKSILDTWGDWTN
jgi:hypothetical protein